ncbi:Small G signaling modulator 3 [Brachionus plicatilis]|uniref:RUN and TBC1 domain-containing protein 3 n=1 Tax=Brachionus plicatilis TaxID=10195 RepID=A0A3M7R6G1_BRAPC|nr:Small G signaling modulator 3 [Brachionus plicatilis]
MSTEIGSRHLKENARNAYWPGHVIADSLTEDNQEIKLDRKLVQKDSKEDKNMQKLRPGGAFSAIISSMLPLDSINQDDQFCYDPFGFKIEQEQPVIYNDNFIDINLSSSPRPRPVLDSFTEDSKHKLKWIAYLEFTINGDMGSAFSWDQVTSLDRSEKLRSMIRGQGIPHSLRPFIWMRLSSALEKKQKSKFKYVDLFKNSEQDHFNASKQIEKDLLRTLPSNACFTAADSVGIPRLRRVLQTIAWLYPNIGYCQGMGTIVASLLLFLEEEDSFWLMCSILEDLLPASYYSHSLIGVQADMKVLRQLIATYLPELDLQFKTHDIELSLICINWYLTLFSNVFDMKILLRIWDLFFYEGSTALFQITLAMFKANEAKILSSESSSQIFSILTEMPAQLDNADSLMETLIRVASSVNQNVLDSSRRKHQAYLMAQIGQIVNPANCHNFSLIKERAHYRTHEPNRANIFKLIKRTFKKDFNNNHAESKDLNRCTNHSSVHSLNSESLYMDDELKMKNVFQTEFLVNLRQIVLKIAHHFQTQDPQKYLNCSLNADYSVESHNRDYELYAHSTEHKRAKRAKALLDFEKTDDDELGFKKNDIITVLSTKDDHCWIGEVSGAKGWFPSRFVAMIDERNGKVYSSAGDDAVSEKIGNLVRGEFALVIRAIFEHGLKKWSVLGGTSHPWSFIEEAAKKVVEKDFDSVYSRLVLCRTFRLDEDGKVLTPDELLYKSVQAINMSHDARRVGMDVKFRSLLSVGLNERVLHIWLETLCSCVDTVEKWYHRWSFLRSPGWVQIKCELRVLAQFSFLLSQDVELPNFDRDLAINECIKDMLVKHHLFSWDI